MKGEKICYEMGIANWVCKGGRGGRGGGGGGGVKLFK